MKKTPFQTLRESKGLTRTECAKFLDTTYQSVWRWETGIHHPDRRTIRLLESYKKPK